MNPLTQLRNFGQSIWIDSIRRGMMRGGELQRLIDQDGVRGVTSNPTTFERAIEESGDYDDGIKAILSRVRHAGTRTVYEALSVEDMRMAADRLRPVYDETAGVDGFASIEIAPQLAQDTPGSVAAARHLWLAVDRPNAMIKLPATLEGIRAMESLLAEGVNVNATLLFTLGHYEAVARAFLRGAARAPDPTRLASVASIVVSSVDTAVDRLLGVIGSPGALDLRGKIAIANCKIIYQRYREIFFGAESAAVRARGVRVQRLLWSSTGTRNPAYSDVRYVEELIGPDTLNAPPPATLEAFREHGRVRGATLGEGIEEARDRLARLQALGIDLRAGGEQLQAEGVRGFRASMEKLLTALDRKFHATYV